MHKGDKLGRSAVGELTRSRGNIVANPFPDGLEILQLLRDMVKHFESNPTNKEKYDSVLQDHRYLPRNAFKRDLNGTRVWPFQVGITLYRFLSHVLALLFLKKKNCLTHVWLILVISLSIALVPLMEDLFGMKRAMDTFRCCCVLHNLLLTKCNYEIPVEWYRNVDRTYYWCTDIDDNTNTSDRRAVVFKSIIADQANR